MKVAIYGVGAMGTVLGAYLTKAGYDIDLFTRNKNHIEGLRKNGAQITGTINFTQKVKAYLPHEMEGLYDILFLTTKQENNEEIVGFLKSHLAEDGVICVMQNGIPEPKIANIIGQNKVIGCTMTWGATFHGNGVSELTSKPDYDTLTFNIGAYGSVSKDKVELVASMLSKMGKVTIEDNLIGARYAKLLVNASMSGLSVITGATFGVLAKRKQSRYLALSIIKECIDVAKGCYIHIEKLQGHNIVKWMDVNNKFDRYIAGIILQIAMKKHRNIRSSMLRDLSRGLKTEVEVINGVVSEMGKECKVKTPLNDRIIELVHEIELGNRNVSWGNLNEFIKKAT